MNVEQLIRRYRLEPHPEGGWYRELHRSAEQIHRLDGQCRAALTVILFLLPPGEISRWHRVSGADESWHHAGGDPLELFCLSPDGAELRRHRLAGLGAVVSADAQDRDDSSNLAEERIPANSLAPSEPLAIVPAGWWQAARSLGAGSLMSCCVGPGFDFTDFTLMRDLPEDQRPVDAMTELL